MAAEGAEIKDEQMPLQSEGGDDEVRCTGPKGHSEAFFPGTPTNHPEDLFNSA